MAKKKVLILGKLPPPYMGPAIATEIILKSSLNRHYQLLHLDTRINESLVTLGRWGWKKIFQSFILYGRMWKILSREKPVLVLIPFSQATLPFIKDSFFIFMARLNRSKVVLQLRGSNILNWMDHSNALTRWYIRAIIRMCDGMIVLGNNLRSLFKDFLPDRKIFVVPNGGTYDLPEATRGANGIVKILYLANLQSSKGIQDVLLAMAELNKKRSGSFELLVIGQWRDEKFRQECLSIIETNKLPVVVQSSQGVVEKFRALQSADIFVFTPREPEGHPWVIVEALACGLPVISTGQGAIVESVIHEVNGFIVNTHSPSEIASRLDMLLENKELRMKMGKASRMHYEADFTEEKMVQKMVQTFEVILKEK